MGWAAVWCAVAGSAGSSIGKALQKLATQTLPRLSLSAPVLRQYLLSRLWVGGVAADVAGALLMAIAVALAPVSLVQPVQGSGLAILAVFSHFYLGETLNIRGWTAVALACAGTIGMGLSSEQAQQAEGASVDGWRAFLFLIVLVFGLVASDVWLRGRRRIHDRRHHDLPLGPTKGQSAADVVLEVVTGTQAGTCFGLSAVVCRVGFVLHQRGHSVLCVPAGFICSAGLSGSGFLLQTRGLKDGRAVAVSTSAAVASIMAGILMGMTVLGEQLPVSWRLRMARVASCLCILGAVLLLVMADSALKWQQLPDRLQRMLRKRSQDRKVMEKHLTASRARSFSSFIPLVPPPPINTASLKSGPVN
eukprot:jgi/Chlat1/200/Chrsp1S03118